MIGPLVTASWLASSLADVVVADCRWYLDGRSGRAAFEAGHIPGSVWVDVDTDLSAPPSPEGGRHPLPSPAAFVSALGRLGIGPATPVVACDDAGGSIAARLWWMLRQLDRPVAVLDGGLASWTGPLATGSSPVTPVDPGPAPARWPAGATVATSEVLGLVAGGSVLLDARTEARYRGDPGVPDAVPGHIPGAVSAPWAANLGPDGRFLPPDVLRDRYAGFGDDVVASCGSGVTACHDLLAREVAGFGGGRLYPGSWSAWSSDPSRPVATGSSPG